MANMDTSQTLFPILPLGTRAPTGLARMAAQAQDAGAGHNIVYKTIEARSALNKTVSRRRLSLAYSINPYRGCEFGCRYCYARYTHSFFADTGDPDSGKVPAFADPDLFERLIFVKRNAPWLLRQEISRVPPGEEIAIGTATDPYQPVERRARITRDILEIFASCEGNRIGIVTKSDLILRDQDLLCRIAERNTLVVHLTVTTADTALARLLEPRAPRPDLRLAAVRRLRLAGLRAGVLCSPLLPGITDSPDQIDTMAALAAQAGASFFAAEPLFLKSCSRPTFLSFVREHYPHLEAGYAARFGERDVATWEERERLQRMVSTACARYGVPLRSTDALLTRDAGPPKRPQTVASRQARLFA